MFESIGLTWNIDTMVMADFKDLDQIFRMLTPADVSSRLNLPYSMRADPTSAQKPVEFVMEHVMNTDGKGVYPIRSLISEMKMWTSKGDQGQLDKLCLATGPDSVSWKDGLKAWKDQDTYKKNVGKPAPTSTNLNAVVGRTDQTGKAMPDIGFVMCNTPLASPTVRDGHLISVFMNSVPTHIMSMAVPYLDVEFMYDRRPYAENPKVYCPRSPNLIRFLMGARANTAVEGTANRAILGCLYTIRPSKVKSGDKETYEYAPRERSYVDIFCTPQTVVNYDTAGADRYNEILDPSRPFASLESLTFNTTPSVGFMTFTKGTLTMKIHDRSRLVDVADLIKPSEYGFTTVWIQYGWMFPPEVDSSGGMGYSQLFSRMRTAKESFGISNSSVTTDAAGQVTVTLELYTKGAMYAQKNAITIGGVQAVQEMLSSAVQTIRDYREQMGLGPPTGMTKEIAVHQLLNASGDAGGSFDMSNADVKKAWQQLRAWQTGAAKNAQGNRDLEQKISDFVKAVETVADQSGTTFKDRIAGQVRSYVDKKVRDLAGPDPWLPQSPDDPFFGPVSKYLSVPAKDTIDTKKVSAAGGFVSPVHGVCSLAKLLGVFLLEPMHAIGHEVQLVFCTFNDSAGFEASAANIGKFPIEVDYFVDQLYQMLKNTGKDTLTIEEFIGFVTSTCINDNFGLGYGLREFYEPYDGSSGHSLKDTKAPTTTRSGAAAAVRTYESVMSDYATRSGGPWKTPCVEFFVETSSAHPMSSTSVPAVTPPGGTYATSQVTRIIVYDKRCDPYREANMVIGPKNGTEFMYVRDMSKFRKVNDAVEIKMLQLLTQADLVKWSASTKGPNLGNVAASTKANAKMIKDMVSTMVPTLVYGTSASGIINASLSTKSDALLSTANMLRQRRDPKNTVQPNGAGIGGLPVQVIPASLSMTTIGCPLFRPTQVFFVDFNTGTSMDNMYIVTSVQQSISQGKFETTLQFAFQDGYAKYYSPSSMVEALQQEAKWATQTKDNSQQPSPKKPAGKKK